MWRMQAFTFTASDGHPLFVYAWPPEGAARAVIHVTHGLAEHAGRYARFAAALTARGFVVYAHDQRGHGRTAQTGDELGFFAAEDGWRRVVGDAEELLMEEGRRHAGLPLALFGHSMGSFVAQQVMARQSERLAAAVLSGANGMRSPLAAVGRLVARAERWRHGARSSSPLINQLAFGNFNRRFSPARTAFDWLSRDEAEVDKYVGDPLCGFDCSTQLWVDFLDGIADALNPAHKKRVRPDLPVYILAGSRDPVAANGRGAEALAAAYRAAGLTDVTCRLYPDARHELLNETNRDEVTRDLLEWLESAVGTGRKVAHGQPA
jgi:alpha-beta hydrolase superfamily lysophospholipase